ncbi:MAG TPA: S8 family serine peptidase [Mycobacteriales bacterium]|nr:S8 family serine peptidase [Mycobacteriales bacterium]
MRRQTRWLAPLVAAAAGWLTLGAAVPAAASLPDAAPAAPATRYLVSVDAAHSLAVATTSGARLVRAYPDLRTAVISATELQARSLAGRPGVLSISPDIVLRPVEREYTSSEAVLAPDVVAGKGLGTSTAGQGVGIAVIDTGIDDSAALNRASGRLRDGWTATAGDFTDGYGHGTFIASLAAGGAITTRGLEGSVVPGIAPGATVYSVKVAGNDGTANAANVLDGLQWVYNNAKTVKVAVFAFAAPPGDYKANPLTAATSAVAEQGVTLAVAAGNDPAGVALPAYNPTVLAVGSATTIGAAPARSAFSPATVIDQVCRPDVDAAGEHLLGVLAPQSVLGKQYGDRSNKRGLTPGTGTSMAAGVAAGVAATFIGRNPNASRDDVRASLIASSAPIGSSGCGEGLLTLPTTVTPGGKYTYQGKYTDGSGTFTSTAQGWSAQGWSAQGWSAQGWSAQGWSAQGWSAQGWSAQGWSAQGWSAQGWS